MRQVHALWLVVLAFSILDPSRASGQGYAANEAAGRMTVAAGLEVGLFASEPMVRQPVAVEFDDRGRAWVIQYLQYPNPAGLRRVNVDRYSRTIYDRMPDPPPHGPAGSDRITILEDRDGDGRADQSRDFVQGLNLASGLAFGYGGVFVLQAPYLLFYADRNRDDRPDGNPEVLLKGFGIEDAHSVANSLTWGPDGWLYGVQGSTVTAKIGEIEFQQGVWRYHPRSRRFELYCEGGGNMWGLDFDRRGQLFASTNVGGFVMLHGLQGGYYWKSFGKHGPLHNPYTFGYFDHVRHEAVKGGHVAVGGLFYEADAFPVEWRGRYIAGDLLDHSIHFHELSRAGSTYRARQIGDVLVSNDRWFAPSDMTLGPDGSLYVTDWHDKRTAHPDPDAEWDRSNGRIYVIRAQAAKARPMIDVNRRSDSELVDMLRDANVWYRRRARRVLAERGASGVRERLRSTAIEGNGTGALEALWSLYCCDGLDDEVVSKLLGHADPDMRGWCVRLVGDALPVAAKAEERLVGLAIAECDPGVRAQLVCTAQRLSARAGLDVAFRVLSRDEGTEADPQLGLLAWWAVERHAIAELDRAVGLFGSPDGWRSVLIRSAILERLARRLAYEHTRRADAACARLIAGAPSDEHRRPLLAAVEEALRGSSRVDVAPELSRTVVELTSHHPEDATLTKLAARVGNDEALERVRATASSAKAPEATRVVMIEFLGEIKDRSSLGLLLELAIFDGSSAGLNVIASAALSGLGRFDDPAIATRLLAVYPERGAKWRARTRDLLLSRATWAKTYLEAIDSGQLAASDVTLEQLGRFVETLRAPELGRLVQKHWGLTRGATREERLAEVRRLNNDLRAAAGDAVRGRGLFRERCAACHQLHGEGETLGPDLTFANRADRDFLLVSLVDPSGAIRKEYQTFQLATRDGRILSGLIVEQTPDSVMLRDAKRERTRVARAEIEGLKETDVSMMPESLYKEFSPEQLRDLFAYLQKDAAGSGK